MEGHPQRLGADQYPAALVSDLPQQVTVAGQIHWYSALALILLAAGHTLAALKHHRVDRSDVLLRMVDPRRSPRS